MRCKRCTVFLDLISSEISFFLLELRRYGGWARRCGADGGRGDSHVTGGSIDVWHRHVWVSCLDRCFVDLLYCFSSLYLMHWTTHFEIMNPVPALLEWTSFVFSCVLQLFIHIFYNESVIVIFDVLNNYLLISFSMKIQITNMFVKVHSVRLHANYSR